MTELFFKLNPGVFSRTVNGIFIDRLRMAAVVFILLFASNVFGHPFDVIRQHFEIYQRFPGELEIFATDNTEEIDHALNRLKPKRLAVRKALEENASVEELDTQPALPTLLFADDWLAPFLDYILAERAFAKRSLQRAAGDRVEIDEAVKAVQYAYRLADEFSLSGSMALRRAAARIRLQMLEIAQLIVQHPRCRADHHQALYSILEEQINHRQTDKAIWENYRDEGLRFFTKMETEGADAVIPADVYKKLLDRKAFGDNKTARAIAERTADDKSVFSRVSSAIIESTSLLYFQRQAILRAFDQEIRQRRGAENEPVVSILLLQDVSEMMQQLAQERSGIETAYLALSASLGYPNRNRPDRSKMLNYQTGNAYEIRLIPDGVMCTYQGNIKPFYVPYR